jgi:hypothetical protein
MINIELNVSVVKIGKGRFVAHADVFPITTKPASTLRGAIKELRDHLSSLLSEAAEKRTLSALLLEAGYPAELPGLDKISLRPGTYDSYEVSMALPRHLLTLNRKRRRPVAEERTRHAIN